MIISLIAAMSQNRVIGNRGSIPWNLPSDKRRFREITMGHAVVFGRVTFESIGHALPGRRNIVLTRQSRYRSPGVEILHGLDQIFAVCKEEDEVFICGGGTVYQETIALADRIYLSVIDQRFEGDTFFPPIPGFFREVAREEIEDSLPYRFIRYQRKS